MIKHPVAVTKNKKEVYVDLVASKAGKQIAAQPHLVNLAQEILSSEDYSGERVIIERHMGRVIGTSDVVKTTDKDTIFYAKTVGSQEFMRFVKNRSYTPSHYLTLVLREEAEGYLLTAIMIGRHRPELPDSLEATPESAAYWTEHASIWEPRVAQLQSITKECPWASLTPANS